MAQAGDVMLDMRDGAAEALADAAGIVLSDSDKPLTSSEAELEPVSSWEKSILFVDNVSVSFDGFKALNNLSLVLAPGELRCIIGPNGAGKTTMLDVITGKTRPTSGKVYMNGQS